MVKRIQAYKDKFNRLFDSEVTAKYEEARKELDESVLDMKYGDNELAILHTILIRVPDLVQAYLNANKSNIDNEEGKLNNGQEA